MVRAILNKRYGLNAKRVFLLSEILLFLLLSRHEVRAEPLCANALPEAASLVSNIDQSPLYLLLKRKLGQPIGCNFHQEQDNNQVTIMFPRNAKLEFSVNEILESSSQDVVIAPTSIMLTRVEGIHVLRAVERSSVAPNGCGIAWSDLSNKTIIDGEDIFADGKSCNCKAHLKMNKNAVVGLGFSMAC